MTALLLLSGAAQAQQTVVTFDNPAPSGAADSFINGTFQGINFGTSQWRWSPPFASDPTNNIYFASSTGTSRTFSFSPAPRILNSMRVYTPEAGTMTLSDGVNPTITRAVTVGSMQTITTGWTQGSTTVTVSFTAGWALGVDDITYSSAGAPDTTLPTVSMTAPAQDSTIVGTATVSASASDNVGVVGVQFLLDGAALGAEDTSAPYSIAWNSNTAGNGAHQLSARARDAAGNTTTASVVSVTVNNETSGGTSGYSLRFRGNGVNDIDRVKIRVDDPATTVAGPPVDVGATDFTIEFWINAAAGENTAPAIQCSNNNWIFGNIIFDRDRYNQDRAFGISLAGGRIAFGVTGASASASTICGGRNLQDGVWHHVAVQRRLSDGFLSIYVDGVLDGQGAGPTGNVSYPDNGVPGSFCGTGGNQPCTSSDPFLVIGAEKHDAGSQFVAYRGYMDEVRISTSLRYTGNFTRPTQPFIPDGNTAALYHFDEGQGNTVADSSGAIGGPSNGERRFGGNPAGPEWTTQTPFVTPGAAEVGQWNAPANWPLVTIHTSLLRTGEVLTWDGETFGGIAGPSVRLWNPVTGVFTQVPNTRTDIFCAGHSLLPDGRLLSAGGNVDLYIGINDTEIFNPATRTWSAAAPMAYDRWYPTNLTLGDGRVLVISGSTTCANCIADIPEIYNPANNTWTQLNSARLDMPLYPFLFLLPDGRAIVPGSDEDPMATYVLNLQTQTWSVVDARVLEGGAAVMYRPGEIMKSGTAADVDRPSAPSIRNTYVLNMNQDSPSWQETAPMAFPRGLHNLTILPDGSVLATGGGRTTDGVNLAQAVLEAEIWSPQTQTWTTVARAQSPRLYHSTALLLPDGRVLSSGGGRFTGFPDINQLNAEIYSPPYLFKGARPVIASLPATGQYNTSIFVTTADTNIARVTLLAPGSVTHSVNMHQRFLELSFQAGQGGVTVQLPAHANLAPAGDYMLFLINSNGVPSVGSFIKIGTQSQEPQQPAPVLTSIAPNSATAGAASFVLTVNGSDFAANSVVRWNGQDRATTRLSAAQLTATITAADVASAGTATVTVFTPSPGGGLSGGLSFVVNNPAPTASSLSPGSATAGGASFQLTVTGANFNAGSVIRWNGSNRTTTFVSATQLTAAITSADVAAAGTAQVTVFAPSPGGGTTAALSFAINNPAPTLGSLSPNSTPAGSNGFNLTVNGTGFVSGSTVRWNGANRTTSFVSATQLTAAITSADVAAAGTAQVTVANAAPGGGVSGALSFSIEIAGGTNPVPAVTTLNPVAVNAGGAAFTLTVDGSNFVNGSVVRWNGASRTTMFVSATRLTASITAADIASAGTASVTVFSPTPGGGASGALTLTITAVSNGSGLVAAYGFNAGSGSVAADSSGNGNNGTLNGASWNATGRYGAALSFNGSSNYVTVPDSASLDLTTGMTLEAWVNPTVAPTGWRTILTKEGSNAVMYYLQGGSDSSNRPAMGVTTSNVERVLYGGTRLTANTWVHLAATYDGATQRLFVNGVQVASRAQTGAIQTSTGALRIGGNALWGEYFQGLLDEVRIYNRALSATEIQTDMNAPVQP